MAVIDTNEEASEAMGVLLLGRSMELARRYSAEKTGRRGQMRELGAWVERWTGHNGTPEAKRRYINLLPHAV